MKNQFMKAAAILFIGLAVVSCKKAQNETDAKAAEDVAEVVEAAKYKADASASTITWKGSAPTKSHNGTLSISEGSLALEGGELTGGNFIIDMNSMVNLDIEDETYNGKLIGHLKSADFFDVENNAFSAFAITGVEKKDGKTMVKGNLTIKGIKKNIEFPATVSVDGDAVSFTSETFNIDRTEWDVKYNSGKFFEDLKDKLIDDNIELSFDVKATKAAM